VLNIIARAPIPGRTKTRLIPALGEAGAATLSAAMLTDVIALARATGLPWRVCHAGPGEHPAFEDAPRAPQLGADLSEILTDALGGGGLAIGSDCVLLGPDVLAAAHAAAASGTTDLVLGLSLDGGYTFVAASARAVAAGVFKDVPWSTARTGQAQLERARALGLATRGVDGTFDVDEPADIARLAEALREAAPALAPATRAALASLLPTL
jgi:glycosyltransferase A (GT-A) superfamily protein (DUF2064 family)